MHNQPLNQKRIIAFVGMPGAGKSIAASYLREKQFPIVRFGEVTEAKLRELQLPITPKNEEFVREGLRKEFGMAVYAIQSVAKIKELLQENTAVIIDGLYSWEEYLYLKKQFPHLLIVHIYTQPEIRYKRLATRSVRAFTYEEATLRDVREIEHLSKGGPIAIADYLIDNNGNITELQKKIDEFLEKYR